MTKKQIFDEISEWYSNINNMYQNGNFEDLKYPQDNKKFLSFVKQFIKNKVFEYDGLTTNEKIILAVDLVDANIIEKNRFNEIYQKYNK